tara:strand:+ start:1011 stop:1397 length:387 start_codon:yes stop_codon:yes gene_type:complete
MLVNIPVSVGELFDKISILEIKKKKIKNKEHLKTIKYELNKLNLIIKKKKLNSMLIRTEFNKLKNINLRLWNIEDKKRKYEKNKNFNDNFIYLARKVYLLNDKRALIKLNINNLSGSQIKEVKSYEKY